MQTDDSLMETRGRRAGQHSPATASGWGGYSGTPGAIYLVAQKLFISLLGLLLPVPRPSGKALMFQATASATQKRPTFSHFPSPGGRVRVLTHGSARQGAWSLGTVVKICSSLHVDIFLLKPTAILKLQSPFCRLRKQGRGLCSGTVG